MNINDNESFYAHSFQAACGGLISNSMGVPISTFHVKLSYYNSLCAELWALKHGIKIARDLQVQNVDFEMDSKAVVSIISKATSDVKQLFPFIAKISKLLNCTGWRVSLAHIYIEANKCVDFLAYLDHTGSFDVSFLDVYPPPS